MNIEELEKNHWGLMTLDYDDNIRFTHTKLSIQFAIEVLEELDQIWVGDSKVIYVTEVEDKIKELKQNLNEKV